MRKFFIRQGKFEGEYPLYESEAEFKAVFPDHVHVRWARDDYTKIQTGTWCESEDGYIMECLAVKKLVNKGGQTTFIYRFPNYLASVYIRKNGTQRWSKWFGNIASLDANSLSTYQRTGMVEQRIKFAAFVAAGMSLVKAYDMAVPGDKGPLGLRNNKLIRLMNDKLVVKQLSEHLSVFKTSIDNKFSNDRLLQEIDDLLVRSKKGSDAHRKNIEFILQLKGILKPVKNNEIEEAKYEEEKPPFE